MEYTELQKQFNELKEKQKDILSQMRDIGKSAMVEMFQLAFERYPKLESFSWQQYTPYFNDGDTCEFGVNADELDINDFSGSRIYFKDGIVQLYNRGEYRDIQEFPFTENEWDELQDYLGKVIYSFEEETLRAIFGDHIEVKVTREGIEVDDYDHD